MQLEFKSGNIYYTSKGKGNPLILLHGFLESSTIWENISKKISQRRQVICIDLPGHGRSDVLAETHTMELMAEAVHAVLEYLEIEKADFLGHSMGGYVSLAYLESHPEAVRKIVLLNSTPTADSEERKENRDRAISVVAKNKSAFVSMAISNLLSRKNSEKFKKDLDKLKEEAQIFPTNGIIAALKGMKIRTNRTDLLKEFRGGKIFISGSDDPILPIFEVKKAVNSTNSRLFVLSGGHLGYLENEQDFEEIVHFIE